MKYLLTAIRDDVSHEFFEPTQQRDEATAVRAFSSQVMASCQRKEGLIWSHVDDFSLWSIAEYDSESGSIEPCTPELICRAADFKE